MNGTWISLKSNQVPTTDAWYNPWRSPVSDDNIYKVFDHYREKTLNLLKESNLFLVLRQRAIDKKEIPELELQERRKRVWDPTMNDCRDKLKERAEQILTGLFKDFYRKNKISERDKDLIKSRSMGIGNELTGLIYKSADKQRYEYWGRHG